MLFLAVFFLHSCIPFSCLKISIDNLLVCLFVCFACFAFLSLFLLSVLIACYFPFDCLFVLLVSLSSLFSCYQQSQCAGMVAISDGSSEAQDKLQEKIYKSLQPLYANIVSELYRNFFSLIGYLEGEGFKRAL